MLLIHGLGPITHGAEHACIYGTAIDEAYRAIVKLKDEGAIAAI